MVPYDYDYDDDYPNETWILGSTGFKPREKVFQVIVTDFCDE